MHLRDYDEGIYHKEDALLEQQIIDVPDLKIIASDYNARSIENARKNAVAAGVSKLIRFELLDFADTSIPSGNGVVFMNPEYGERLGEYDQLEKTYARMGDFMKQKCGGYTGYVFTGNLDLAKKIGLKAKRRIEFYTSTIDCRLLEYELYAGSRVNKEQSDTGTDT
jgi:putative N6-adenine-specific DNA methylase